MHRAAALERRVLGVEVHLEQAEAGRRVARVLRGDGISWLVVLVMCKRVVRGRQGPGLLEELIDLMGSLAAVFQVEPPSVVTRIYAYVILN